MNWISLATLPETILTVIIWNGCRLWTPAGMLPSLPVRLSEDRCKSSLLTGSRVYESIAQDFKKPIDKKDPAIRYAEQAREEARADLKKKRSAPYLTSDLPTKVRSRKLPTASNAERPKPTAPFQKNTSGEFTKFGDRLQQDNYILADIQPEYSPQPQEPEEKPKKNNYDFLKTSQIYNQDRAKEEQLKHSKAQELNLTGLDSD